MHTMAMALHSLITAFPILHIQNSAPYWGKPYKVCKYVHYILEIYTELVSGGDRYWSVLTFGFDIYVCSIAYKH